MISVREAMAMIENKFPDKRLRGNPCKLDNLLLFNYVDKNETEEQAMWNNGLIGVNVVTGKMSHHSVFDKDIMQNAKPILEY